MAPIEVTIEVETHAEAAAAILAAEIIVGYVRGRLNVESICHEFSKLVASSTPADRLEDEVRRTRY